MQNFQQAPGYQFALDQGIKGLDASAAKRGLLASGNQEQAVQNYGTGLANSYYQQYLQNLQQQAGQGQTATNGLNASLLSALNGQAQSQQNAAAAQAALGGQKATQHNSLVASLLNAFL